MLSTKFHAAQLDITHRPAARALLAGGLAFVFLACSGGSTSGSGGSTAGTGGTTAAPAVAPRAPAAALSRAPAAAPRAPAAAQNFAAVGAASQKDEQMPGEEIHAPLPTNDAAQAVVPAAEVHRLDREIDPNTRWKCQQGYRSLPTSAAT